MSDADDLKTKTLERVASGIPGLDTILGGGFLRGGVYLVHAKPGSGKTILGNQICFRHVAGGGRALVVTLLTESHSRLLSQLENLTFFDAACVGSTLSYVSGYQALETDKLKGLLLLLRRTVRDHKATLLVIDGVVTAGAMAESELETKKFIHELQVFVELVGCTTLLLTGATAPAEQYAFRTMVDGLLELELDAVGMEAARTIEIAKFRGGAVLMGRHLFEITNAGITVYPRTESRARPVVGRPDPGLVPPAAFGIQGLDGMLAGGLRPGSITMALGTPGSGKTLLGLSMLAAGAKLWEPGLYFGFSETAVDLAQKAQGMGIPLAAHVDSGLVDIMWQSPLDSIADALAERLLEAVRARKVRRLFIDGLHGFKTSLVYPARAERFFTALCDELRSLGVVTLISDEMLSLGAVELPRDGLTTSLDNVILLRHVETQARIHKFVSVMKMRAGAGDSAVREFSIDARGFSVTSDEVAATGLLSEVIRESPPLEASRRPGKTSKTSKTSKTKRSPRARRR